MLNVLHSTNNTTAQIKRRQGRRAAERRARIVAALDGALHGSPERLTRDEFVKRFGVAAETVCFAEFLMNVSVREYFALLAEATGDDRWLEKCGYMLHYSDADEEYRFKIATAGSNINENVTVGELLMVAHKLYEYADSLDDDDDYFFEDEVVDSSEVDDIKMQCEYIVYTLMIEPFEHIEAIREYLVSHQPTR